MWTRKKPEKQAMDRRWNGEAASLGWQAGSPARLGAQIARTLRASWEAYWSWRAKRATVRILRTLDARTLQDIGVSASEIESAVYGHPDRLRCYDATWWR
jgi:uncharacterized protein YjiS (DUF1127 family)